MFISVLSLVFLLFVAGCSSKESGANVKTVGEFDNAPTWVQTQQIANKVSGFGIAKQKDHTFREQRDAAIASAQEDLREKLHTKILQIFKLINDTTLDQELYNQNVIDATDELLKNALQDARVVKLWQSYSKTIYVIVATDTQKIKKEFRIVLDVIFKEMPSVASNYQLKLEQGIIDRKLSN